MSGNELATYSVPCGKCDSCVKARAKSWFVRLKYELKVSLNAQFVTLTYENPPLSFNGNYTTDKTHLQKFMKRLRYYESCRKKNPKSGRMKRYYNNELKYYAVSEYGEKHKRPHYHVILFNCMSEKSIYNAWHYGQIDIGEVNNKSINYVCGYIGKKIGIPVDDDDDREPECAHMSQGLGLSYIEKTGHWNKQQEETTVVIEGLTYAVPRYIRNKLFPYYKVKRVLKFRDKDGNIILKEQQKQTTVQKRIGKKALHKLAEADKQKRKLHSLRSKQDYDYLKWQNAEIRNEKSTIKNSKF